MDETGAADERHKRPRPIRHLLSTCTLVALYALSGKL
jgi:hypothetical protein